MSFGSKTIKEIYAGNVALNYDLSMSPFSLVRKRKHLMNPDLEKEERSFLEIYNWNQAGCPV